MDGTRNSALQLEDGSRVGVVGGGPSGSFFSYFLLELAERTGLQLQVDIYEPRDFNVPGPTGCNMCGGIVSESLVQNLAAEGINLPPAIVQRTIESYSLHMDVGNVCIETPQQQKRIASVHRGGGPRGIKERKFGGLDGYLLDLAVGKGANRIRSRVDEFTWADGRPQLKTQGGTPRAYDLVAAAVGVNTSALKLFQAPGLRYRPPRSTRTYICEYCFGRDMIKRDFGYSMHVFLLNLPRLEFAALIPKGDYVTLCLLGDELDKELVREFLACREVQETLPANWSQPADFCHCSPRISVGSATHPFADRVVFVGDCGVTRLYKDGIGAAYRTAKAAAKTAALYGIAAKDFRRHFWPVCNSIRRDNMLGRLVFTVTRQIQKREYARRGLWRMISKEQHSTGGERRMSLVLWDTFTGSAPYSQVLLRTLHPAFLARLLWETAAGAWQHHNSRRQEKVL